MKTLPYPTPTLALALLLAVAIGCSDEKNTPDGGADSGVVRDSGGHDVGPDSAVLPPAKVCTDMSEKQVAMNTTGPFGQKRHELAADFTVKLQDGSDWTLSKAWTGCEIYIFVPDTIRASQASGAASVWDKDVATLLGYSPRNVHYFFVGASSAAQGGLVQKAMQTRVDTALAALGAADQAHWKERVHVVATHASSLTGWLKPVLTSGVGTSGLAIDRFQRLRGVGSLADVHRYSSALAAAKLWPYESNLAYVAHDAMYYNFEATRQQRLDAETGVKELQFWKGEVIKEYAEMDMTLPSATEMKAYDTLELDVTQRCPNSAATEFGNCGAWDYLSHLYIKDSAGTWLEIARAITTYHREGRWVVDISPMLPRLAAGGKQRFKWLWAPTWNKQPTATWLSLRLSNRKKGYRATKLTPLYQGGTFNDKYNPSKKPMTVTIPTTAKRVELWALISGHGSSGVGCAEFCSHQHQFTVNGKTFLQEYPEASSRDGCMKKISKGVVPNQWGTWWLGRGGWCPGQEVPAYQVDLTSTAPAGKQATISYKGLFKNADPTSSTGGNIKLESYLVVYE